MKLWTYTSHHFWVNVCARRWIFLGVACLQGIVGAQPQNPGFAAPPTPAPVNDLRSSGGSYQGSLPTGQATKDVLQLSLDDAIARGLKYNLGLVTTQQNTRTSNADRLRALSQLLPNLSGGVQGTREQLDLASFGFSGIKGLPLPTLIGPFNVFDARASLTQKALDFSAVNNHRASIQSQRAAGFSVRDSQDQVVFVVVNLYLQAITGASRIVSAQAQVTTSQALYNLAVDQKKAGVVPSIDVLRSEVQLQSDQQRLIFYRNEFEKAKLSIARAIGLPPGQAFSLQDQAPYAPLEGIALDQALDQAYRTRSDYKAALALVSAAERTKEAARAERLPTIALNADYGAIGTDPASARGTFTLGARLQVPIYQGGRIRADIEQADAQLQQRRSEAEDLRGKIDSDVRSAFLDLKSYEEQLRIARRQIDLAKTQLQQSQDRFAAGVTNNVEVVQSQQSVVSSDDNFISSLYNYNLAKASLTRAIGLDAEAAKKLFGGAK
jgi:outer membrane protein TolC